MCVCARALLCIVQISVNICYSETLSLQVHICTPLHCLLPLEGNLRPFHFSTSLLCPLASALLRDPHQFFSCAVLPDRHCVGKFNVLITTDTLVMKDKSRLKRFSWLYVILDEVCHLRFCVVSVFTVSGDVLLSLSM